MLQEPVLHLCSGTENLAPLISTTAHSKRRTDKPSTEDIRGFCKVSQERKMPGLSTVPRTQSHCRSGSNNTDPVFIRPNSLVSSKLRASAEPTLKKSSSYQNIKTANNGKGQTTMHLSHLQVTQSSKRKNLNSKQKHSSAANIPTVCSKNAELTSSEPHFRTHLNTQSNAHRISVNSDLLSRVEREKKQYEARISELTQVTETRKMEIEKLTFEVRRAKEEASKAASLMEEIKLENTQLRNQLLALGSPCKKDGEQGPSVEVHQNTKSNLTASSSRRLFTCTSSPPESLGTTTRLTPGGTTTAFTGGVTASSVSSEWNDTAPGFDLCPTEEPVVYDTNYSSDLESIRGNRSQNENSVVSIATLQGRLLQMEEANYTTNEELQATLQELWDLQRSVDEAHEEAHSLAFERAILLEALSTQTSKLEHCRFQIEQLKHLLLTDRNAQIPGSRENHFCELYASIEQEKQVLLGQNNDLAQSSESLAHECRILTEKASALQDSYDALEVEHSTLEKAYQSVSSELTSLKSQFPLDCCEGSPDKEDSISNHFKKFSVAVQTDCIFLIDSPENPLTVSMNEDKKKLSEITIELHKIKEKYELLHCEREREQTEWRLYERDLLKAVQVADEIKTESELESRRLNSENESLKEQVEKLTEDSTRLNSEITLLKDKINLLSSRKFENEHQNFASDLHRSEGVDKPSPGSISIPSTTPTSNQPILSANVAHNVCPSSSAYLTTNIVTNSCRLTPGTLTDNSYPGRSSIMHPFTTHRSTGFSHTGHLHSTYPGSPGAPGRPSALSTGPTVRSLIQSIENQVKAVQHQKRSTTSASVNSSGPVRLYTNTNNNGTSNRQNISSCLSLMSPVGYPGKSTTSTGGINNDAIGNSTANQPKLRSTITNAVISSSEISQKIKNQENADLNSLIHTSSAPGGPSSTVLNNQNITKKFPLDNINNNNNNNQRNVKTPLGTSTIMNSSTGPTTVFSGLNQFTKIDSKDVLLRRNNSVCGTNVKTGPINSNVIESSNSTPNVVQAFSPDTATKHTPGSGSCESVKADLLKHKEPPPRSLDLVGFRRFTSSTIPDNTSGKAHTGTSSCTTKNIINSSDNVNIYTHESNITSTNVNANLLSVNLPQDHSSTSTSFHSIHQVWQDPLQELARLTGAGSKRNALLRWCQSRVLGYRGVEVTNFSSSWNNGLALCALMHTYVPAKIPWNDLITSNGLPVDKRRCFEIAFKVAENEGIPTTLQLQDMLTTERPDWNSVMTYITSIYRHYEVGMLTPSTGGGIGMDSGLPSVT
ncbi:hypothetical protein MN116_001555 [Schistosoma mekongi]|uniref:Calponin-homology (CH) domain-containing protein n=1 Tax=Schistosoma mekongi TaxID=38744 RepID=A0AAE1ZHH7_SCHME|nr:hypothetical protein MN116_001555 [Schistosoma mekongi]